MSLVLTEAVSLVLILFVRISPWISGHACLSPYSPTDPWPHSSPHFYRSECVFKSQFAKLSGRLHGCLVTSSVLVLFVFTVQGTPKLCSLLLYPRKIHKMIPQGHGLGGEEKAVLDGFHGGGGFGAEPRTVTSVLIGRGRS